jgi:glycosyltransferase involved in cell wall biosynthesis
LKSHGIKIINTGKNLERFFDNKYSKSRSLLGFYHSTQLKKLIQELQPGLVFVAHEAFKPLETINSKEKYRLIHYVHNPYEFVPDPSESIPPLLSFFTRRYIIKENDFSNIVLANSRSTRNECIRRWSRNDCIVLYPPIKMDEISFSSFKEDVCIVLSRISPEKRIELAIEVFRSKILQDKQLTIIGYVSRENRHYYQRLLQLSKERDNVKILPNLRRKEVLTLLSKAKVLFHPMPNEHFGIAVVEAMASGCLPVVHASGGPLEVVENGLYGLVYREAYELPELLNYAFNSSRNFQYKVRNRALQFDIKYFSNKFISLINRIRCY